MDWTPPISELSGPRYQRIVEAMEADIAAGRLVRGQQLPTQRALAKALGIDLTTVTRAYTEARRRGIMEARVGQGSFVSETSARRAVDLPHPVAIDLSMNVPPHPLEAQLDERIMAGLEAIRAQSGLTAYLNYQPPGGSVHEREVAARWLRARVPHAVSRRSSAGRYEEYGRRWRRGPQCLCGRRQHLRFPRSRRRGYGEIDLCGAR